VVTRQPQGGHMAEQECSSSKACRRWRAHIASWCSREWLLSRRNVWISMILLCSFFWAAAIGVLMRIV
jgi:hypothetical protein